MDEVTILPDGSAFFVGSLPLPKDHWIYAPRCEGWDSERDTRADTPQPIVDNSQREAVKAAIRYAVRGTTMNGTDMDFDPDALVQNATYALCGPCGNSGAEHVEATNLIGDDMGKNNAKKSFLQRFNEIDSEIATLSDLDLDDLFAKMPNRISGKKDVQAMVILDRLSPGGERIISYHRDNAIFFDCDIEKLGELATDSDIRNLCICGIFYEERENSFAIFI